MARLEIENDTLDVHWILHLMSQDVRNTVQDDESFKKLVEMYINSTNGTQVVNSMEKEAGNLAYSSVSVILGTIFVLVGLSGLFFKMREAATQNSVKFVKSTTSLFCVVAGILLTICEVVKYSAHDVGFYASKVTVFLQKVSILALKNHTIIVYLFQTVMIYCPFFFREHKASFAKWLLGVTSVQWVATICAPLSWTLAFLLTDWDDCIDIMKSNNVWHYCYIALLTFSYLGSFTLSFIYLVGYTRKSRKNVGSTQKISIKQTLVSCSVEIVYDLAAVIYELYITSNCALKLENFTGQVDRSFVMESRCDLSVRFDMLDWGVTHCLIWVMLIQQLVQEMVFLVTAIRARCRGK